MFCVDYWLLTLAGHDDEFVLARPMSAEEEATLIENGNYI